MRGRVSAFSCKVILFFVVTEEPSHFLILCFLEYKHWLNAPYSSVYVQDDLNSWHASKGSWIISKCFSFMRCLNLFEQLISDGQAQFTDSSGVRLVRSSLYFITYVYRQVTSWNRRLYLFTQGSDCHPVNHKRFKNRSKVHSCLESTSRSNCLHSRPQKPQSSATLLTICNFTPPTLVKAGICL